MKYAFLILLILSSFNIYSKSIAKLSDSSAIVEINEFMKDNQENFISYYQLSDKKMPINESMDCRIVKANDVLSEFKNSFKVIMRKFPEEELPYEEAINDMSEYLDGKIFHSCNFQSLIKNENSNSQYFESLDNSVFLRMDNIAPLHL